MRMGDDAEDIENLRAPSWGGCEEGAKTEERPFWNGVCAALTLCDSD